MKKNVFVKGCLPIILIISVFVIISKNAKPDKKAIITPSNVSIDTVVSHIKKDPAYNIKNVFYRENDKSLNIVMGSKNNIEQYILYANEYFNKFHNVYGLSEIDNIFIYEFKVGNSIKDYQEPALSDDRWFYEKRQNFYKNNGSGIKGFYDVKRYLEYNLDDPKSLEMIAGTIIGINENETFKIKSLYRAKSKYGGLMFYTMYCDVDMEGNVSNVEIQEGGKVMY